jgi:hypothetical protein
VKEDVKAGRRGCGCWKISVWCLESSRDYLFSHCELHIQTCTFFLACTPSKSVQGNVQRTYLVPGWVRPPGSWASRPPASGPGPGGGGGLWARPP